jgi:hypothetical protein
MITQEQVKALFEYKDGHLIRRVTRGPCKKGSIAGTTNPNEWGYLKIKVGRKIYASHRLIFLYHFGYLPNEIDHINGITLDNRIENLRPCTRTQNSHNVKAMKGGTSEKKGLSWCVDYKMWRARISVCGKAVYLGRFWDEETAAQVVRIARLKYHGEFANHG